MLNIFSGCSSLISISVESGNTTYDSRDNCNAIIETARNTLIIGCNNTTIPNSVTSIGQYAFFGCSNLRCITSLIEDPFRIDTNTFESEGHYEFDENLQQWIQIRVNDIYNNVKLIVPDGTIEKYKSTESWMNFANIIEQGESSSITLPKMDSINGSSKIYTLDGKNISTLKKGLNIIRMKDGTTRKLVVK